MNVSYTCTQQQHTAFGKLCYIIMSVMINTSLQSDFTKHQATLHES